MRLSAVQGAEHTAKGFQYASSLFAFFVQRRRPERLLDQSRRTGRRDDIGPAAGPLSAGPAGIVAGVTTGARSTTIPAREEGRNTLHYYRAGSLVRVRRAAVALLATKGYAVGQIDGSSPESSVSSGNCFGWTGDRGFPSRNLIEAVLTGTRGGGDP